MARLLKSKIKGDQIYAEEWNAILAELRRLANWDVVGAGLEVGDFGFLLSVGAGAEQSWPGIVVSTGPSAEADPSDNTYWIKRVRPDNATDPVTMSAWANLSADLRYLHVKATNMAESEGGTHLIAPGSKVEVYIARDTSGDKRYVFFEGLKIGQLFVVALTKTSGAIGTKTSASTWVYTLTSLTGKQLATGKSPLRPRLYGTYGYAANGLAYVDSDGTVKLWEAAEAIGIGGCP